MSDTSVKLTKRRQRLYIKAYGLLTLILFATFGTYSYFKWQEYSELKTGYAENLQAVEVLQDEVANEKAYYVSSKNEFDDLQKTIAQGLETVFPTDDEYTKLVRDMDAIEEELATRNNPFEVSNIDFQNIIEEEEYSILPLRMSIRSSGYNFTKFLHLIETSGTLNTDIRLMDLSSIRLNFENADVADSRAQIINFTVQINAYYQ
jgi:hypothetical protein